MNQMYLCPRCGANMMTVSAGRRFSIWCSRMGCLKGSDTGVDEGNERDAKAAWNRKRRDEIEREKNG